LRYHTPALFTQSQWATRPVQLVLTGRFISLTGSILATKLLLSPISDNPAIPLGSPTFHPPFDRQVTHNRDAPRRLVLYGAGRQVRDHAVLLLKEYHRSIQHVSILNRSAKAGSELLSYLNAITLHSTSHTTNVSRDLSTRTGNTSGPDTATTPTTRQTHITDVKFELFTRENESEWESNWEAATRAADIICMATPSTSPVLKEEWVKPGQHFILVGSYRADMAEVPTTVIRRASKVVVDSRR
jgi:ornithine cyclodeaminase/alanine dehydrogenase-like protein (mu-crystallin family)